MGMPTTSFATTDIGDILDPDASRYLPPVPYSTLEYYSDTRYRIATDKMIIRSRHARKK